MVEGSVAAANIYSSLMATHDKGFLLVLQRGPQLYRLPRMALFIGKNTVVTRVRMLQLKPAKSLVNYALVRT